MSPRAPSLSSREKMSVPTTARRIVPVSATTSQKMCGDSRFSRLGVGEGVHTCRHPRAHVLSLLAGHGDAESLLGGDEVVGVSGVLAEIDLHPVDRAGEHAALTVVVVAD